VFILGLPDLESPALLRDLVAEICTVASCAPDRAEAIWAMRDDLDIPGHEGAGRRRIVGAGHYREEYRRVRGKWRIHRLVLTRLRVDEVTVRLAGPPPEPPPALRET